MVIKESFRRRARALLKEQSLRLRSQKSSRIKKKLFRLRDFCKARTVLFYVSLPEEVQTGPMIRAALRQKKRVVVPLTDLKRKKLLLYELRQPDRDLHKGTLGIYEPVPGRCRPVRATEIDCVIVPGLLFDKKNRRMGRGGGFYDRFFGRLRRGIPKIGLAYSFQVVRRVPCQKHDKRLDRVISG